MEVGECTVGDLIVIVGIAPTPETADGIGVPEGTVLKIRCVCHEADQFSDAEATCRDHTERPVPVRLSAFVSTFLPKRGFEVLDICAMPWQEVTSPVDLGM